MTFETDSLLKFWLKLPRKLSKINSTQQAVRTRTEISCYCYNIICESQSEAEHIAPCPRHTEQLDDSTDSEGLRTTRCEIFSTTMHIPYLSS